MHTALTTDIRTTKTCAELENYQIACPKQAQQRLTQSLNIIK